METNTLQKLIAWAENAIYATSPESSQTRHVDAFIDRNTSAEFMLNIAVKLLFYLPTYVDLATHHVELGLIVPLISEKHALIGTPPKNREELFSQLDTLEPPSLFISWVGESQIPEYLDMYVCDFSETFQFDDETFQVSGLYIEGRDAIASKNDWEFTRMMHLRPNISH